MSISGRLPLTLPPSPFVRQFGEKYSLPESQLILDAGANEGRNSIYLAKLGHRVVAVTNNLAEAQTGDQAARVEIKNATGDCRFVQGDVRRLMFGRVFDVVLSNEVLHMMTKYQARTAIKEMADVTKAGGLHVVSGYVVDPRQANETNNRHCFHPNELLNIYRDADWQVLEYSEDIFNFQEIGTRQIVNSLARIVATR